MNNIPYDEIDELMIPIVKILNENNYPTKWCCQGHKDKEEAYIMFQEGIEDSKMLELLPLFDNNYAQYVLKEEPIQKGVQFKLSKWPRYVFDEIQENWMWTMRGAIWEKHRKRIFNKVYKKLEEHFNEKKYFGG